MMAKAVFDLLHGMRALGRQTLTLFSCSRLSLLTVAKLLLFSIHLWVIDHHIDHVTAFIAGPIVNIAAGVVCRSTSDHLGATGRQ